MSIAGLEDYRLLYRIIHVFRSHATHARTLQPAALVFVRVRVRADTPREPPARADDDEPGQLGS